MDSKKSETSKRLNLIVPETTHDRLQRILNSTSASSMTEVVREALFYYERLVEVSKRGSILLEHHGESVIPFQVSIDVTSSLDEKLGLDSELKQQISRLKATSR